MQITNVTAAQVAKRLKNAETLQDQSLLAHTELVQNIVDSSEKLGLEFGRIQGPLADATEAMSLIVRARHHLGRAHARLLEIGVEREIVPAYGFGDIFPTYDEARDGPITGETHPLRSAA